MKSWQMKIDIDLFYLFPNRQNPDDYEYSK